MISKIWLLSKDDFQELVNSSFYISDVLKELGLSTRNGSGHKMFKERVLKDNIDLSKMKNNKRKNHFQRYEIEEMLTENSKVTRTNLKNRLLKEEIIENKCSICGLETWNGKEIVMILDHINGINNDNRKENLRMVCPNCNSQLDTHCGKNKKIFTDKKKCKCGADISNHSKMCRKCNHEKNEKYKNLDYDYIIKELEKRSITSISKELNIPRQTLSKKIKKYLGPMEN